MNILKLTPERVKAVRKLTSYKKFIAEAEFIKKSTPQEIFERYNKPDWQPGRGGFNPESFSLAVQDVFNPEE